MSAPKSRIADLSSTIVHHTHLIDTYLTEQSLPQPSFDPAGPSNLSLSSSLESSRAIVLSATQELNDLLQGPHNIIWKQHQTQLVPMHLISHFDIARILPVDGEMSFGELAERIGVREGAVRQILRVAMAHRVFSEARKGFVGHSCASSVLVDDEKLRAWCKTRVDDMGPTATRVVDALVKWPEGGEPSQTGYALAHNGLSFYDDLNRHEDKAATFAKAMKLITTGPGFDLRFIVHGFGWSDLPAGSTIVDVGGSTGSTALELARTFPSKAFKFVVQDLGETIASVSESTNTEAAEMGVTFMPHDFFTPQPISANVYLLRWILHNWPEAYCLRIIRALIPSLKNGARVLVMEIVMPAPGSIDNEPERKMRAMDLIMLQIGNAGEKDVEGWKGLFERACEDGEGKGRFVWRGVKVPEGSRLGVMEWGWEA